MNNKMTWQEKLSALQSIAEISLKMRKPGDWYVSASGRSIGGDGLLHSQYGNGTTPEEAVLDDWKLMTEDLPKNKYIVVQKGTTRHQYRWNGFMWGDVP